MGHTQQTFAEVDGKSDLQLSPQTHYAKTEDKRYREKLVLKHNSWSLT